MNWIVQTFGSSVGKKLLMALTGRTSAVRDRLAGPGAERLL